MAACSEAGQHTAASARKAAEVMLGQRTGGRAGYAELQHGQSNGQKVDTTQPDLAWEPQALRPSVAEAGARLYLPTMLL